MSTRLHAIVRGRVQMVGFRYFVLGHAERLNLTGWVRNGDDGRTVEVVAEGAEAALKELGRLLHQGPPSAVIEDINATWSDETEGFPSFSIRS